MTPVYEIGCDVSNYTGKLSKEQVAGIITAGGKFLIAGTQEPLICQQQLAVARSAGLDIAAYVYLWFGYDIQAQVEDALRIISAYPDIRLWLDVEDEMNNVAQADIRVAVGKAIEVCQTAKQPYGIYTSRSKWHRLTGDWDGPDCPLWEAFYDGVDTFDYFQPYGAWREPALKQYAGDVEFGGVKVDMNVRQVGEEW